MPLREIIAATDMRRALPHDISNALVASALCIEPGLVSVAAVSEALRSYEAPHHRIELVADAGEFAGSTTPRPRHPTPLSPPSPDSTT